MKTVNLPGRLVKDVGVFGLNKGDKVLDKASGKQGIISNVTETAPEWVEAFVKFDGEDKEQAVWKFTQLVVL